MRPHFRLQKLTDYPEWHKKPFLLNCAEMRNPYTVLVEFFDRYNLSNIRISLKQWLEDALEGIEAEASSHLYTHENLGKLIEASWVILEQRRQAKADEGFNQVAYEENEEDTQKDTGKVRQRFVKWVTFPTNLKTSPLTYMKRVFEVIDLEGLETIIYRWQKIALAAAFERYHEAGERADLLDYCEGLCRLVEAAYILQRTREWDTEGRTMRPLNENMKHDLLTEEQTFGLTEEEINNPYIVIKAFFETFTPTYIRRELWDMLGCAVECKQEDLNKLDLLLEYECLYGVLEAAWLYYNEQMEKKSANGNITSESA